MSDKPPLVPRTEWPGPRGEIATPLPAPAACPASGPRAHARKPRSRVVLWIAILAAAALCFGLIAVWLTADRSEPPASQADPVPGMNPNSTYSVDPDNGYTLGPGGAEWPGPKVE